MYTTLSNHINIVRRKYYKVVITNIPLVSNILNDEFVGVTYASVHNQALFTQQIGSGAITLYEFVGICDSPTCFSYTILTQYQMSSINFIAALIILLGLY